MRPLVAHAGLACGQVQPAASSSSSSSSSVRMRGTLSDTLSARVVRLFMDMRFTGMASCLLRCLPPHAMELQLVQSMSTFAGQWQRRDNRGCNCQATFSCLQVVCFFSDAFHASSRSGGLFSRKGHQQAVCDHVLGRRPRQDSAHDCPYLQSGCHHCGYYVRHLSMKMQLHPQLGSSFSYGFGRRCRTNRCGSYISISACEASV